MMNNVALMFSPTDKKIPCEQGVNRTVQSGTALSIVHKFLNVSQHGSSLKEYSWVYCELTSSFYQLKI